MFKLLFFIKFIKFLAIISQILFLLCLLFFSSLLPFSVLLLVRGLFFRLEQKDFSLCLLFSSASLNLLLNLSNEVFIPLPYFLIPEFYILFFFIFLSLYWYYLFLLLYFVYIFYFFFACIYSSLFTRCPGFIWDMLGIVSADWFFSLFYRDYIFLYFACLNFYVVCVGS